MARNFKYWFVQKVIEYSEKPWDLYSKNAEYFSKLASLDKLTDEFIIYLYDVIEKSAITGFVGLKFNKKNKLKAFFDFKNMPKQEINVNVFDVFWNKIQKRMEDQGFRVDTNDKLSFGLYWC
jgi:hypothetical protein